MNKMSTVIAFTFLNKIRTKAFLVTTLIMVLIISIGMNIPYLIKVFNGDDDAAKAGTHVAVIIDNSQAARVAELLKDYGQRAGLKDFTVDAYSSADDAALKKGLDDEKVDGYLTLDAGDGKALPPVVLHTKDGKIDQDLRTQLEAALQQVNVQLIAGDKLTQQEIAAMYAPVQLGESKITTDGSNGGEGEQDSPAVVNYVIVYALMMLFFITLTATGNMVSSEVTSEKSSRIMEILITSTAPLAQMFGKVIGIFLVGILQIAVTVAAVAVNLMLPHNAGVLTDFDIDLGQMNISLLVYGLIFYIVGYFLYALLYAAVGSIVSRTEDLGQAILPVMLLGFVNLYLPMFSISAPNTLLVKIASFVPFTSPLSMLLRIGVGEVATWEILLSILILLLSSLLMGWLAAKIYRTGVLMYGKRPSIKELRKAMKAYKI